MKKKVLFVLNSSKYSGAENVVCQIANLLKNEFDFYYCSPLGPIEQSLKDKNVKYVGVNKMSLKNLKKVIKEIKPDIIHANDAKACFLSSICCKKISLICHLHNNEHKIRKFSLKSILFYFACKKAKKVIFVSNKNHNDFYFKNKIEQKSIVIRNIISANDINYKVNLDKNDYDFDVIFLGRLEKEKNPLRVLEIMNKLVCKINAKCAVVGDGSLMEQCKNYIKDNKLQENIKMFGFQKNPFKILKSSKVMLMASVYEGTPMCALESYALNVPIVSTNTDLSEIIKQGETGYVYNLDNEAVDYIEKVFKDNKKFKNNCCSYFKQINNEEKYKNSILNIYENI